MSKFEAGKTYITRSVCDHDCVIRVTVAKRTAKTITTDDGKVLRIGEYEGVEFVKPWGSYSMAPIVRAAWPWAGRPFIPHGLAAFRRHLSSPSGTPWPMCARFQTTARPVEFALARRALTPCTTGTRSNELRAPLRRRVDDHF